MVNFECYQFKDTTYGLTSLPEDMHLTLETSTALYYMKAHGFAEEPQLWKYTIATGTDAQLDADPDDDSGDNKSRDNKTHTTSAWHDRGNDEISFIEIFVGAADSGLGVFKLDITNDIVTDIGDYRAGVAGRFLSETCDIFKVDGEYRAHMFYFDGANLNSSIWDVDAAPFSELATGANEGGTIHQYFGVVIGSLYYSFTGNAAKITPMNFNNGTDTYTEGTPTAAYGLPIAVSVEPNKLGVAYDEDDILYLIGKKVADSKYYLLAYSITEDSFTEIGEYNISPMIDRNTIGTSNSPWEHEKAYHVIDDYVYSFARNRKHLFKIQDLAISGATIEVVTDKYIIDSLKNVYDYSNYINDIPEAEVIYNLYNVPSCNFSYSTKLSTDQLIEFYQRSGSIYIEKSFSGKAGIPEYDANEAMYEYNIENLGYDDLREVFTHNISSQSIRSGATAMLSESVINYLWTNNSTGITGLSTSVTFKYDKNTLTSNLYPLCVRGNAFYTFEPNGFTYMRAYTNPISSGYYYGKPDNFNDEVIGTTGTDIAWVDEVPGTDSNIIAEIIAEEDNHKNVLKMTSDGDNGAYGGYRHTMTQIADTIEFRVKYIDNGVGWLNFRIHRASDAGRIISFHYRSDTNNVYWEYGDGGGGSTTGNEAAAADTWYHIKITYSCVSDTWSLWIDGVLKVDGENFFNDRTAINPTDMLVFQDNGAGANSLESYMDAWGSVADSDYSEGENLNEFIKVLNVLNSPPPTRPGQMQYQYNVWEVFGGVSSNAVRFSTRHEDSAHIQQYGKRSWDGRNRFACAETQANISALALSFPNWQGMQDNPVHFTMEIYDEQRFKVGMRVRYQNSHYTLSETASSYLITKNKVDLKTTVQTITISQTIVKKR